MNSLTLLEIGVIYLPMIGAGLLWCCFRPHARVGGPLLLSFLWNLVSIFGLNQLAFAFGWWHFAEGPVAYHGLPLSIWIGWAVGWGLAAPLIPIKRGSVLVLLAWLTDGVLMPRLDPLLVLTPSWMLGEMVALAVILLPGLAIYRWTLKRHALCGRVVLQAVIFFSLVGFFLPDLIFTSLEGRRLSVSGPAHWTGLIALVGLFFFVVCGLAAVREFVREGGGTPVPFDPPVRLVRTGLYAYLSNPMQASTVGGLLCYAWWLQSWGVAAAALMVLVYSVGFALPSESVDLEGRFGSEWNRHRARSRPFVPRWRPIPPRMPATIYFARDCSMCHLLGRWLASKDPAQLKFVAAEDYLGQPLRRLRYEDGQRRYDGVAAFARGLHHVHFGWSLVAVFIEFPVFKKPLQLIADADLFGANAAPPLRQPTPASWPGSR